MSVYVLAQETEQQEQGTMSVEVSSLSDEVDSWPQVVNNGLETLGFIIVLYLIFKFFLS